MVSKKLGERKHLLRTYVIVGFFFGALAMMTIATFPVQRREDWRACTQFLNMNVNQDDVVLIFPRGCDKALNYYGLSHDYYYVGGHRETVEWASQKNSTVWVVAYTWGVQRGDFEALLFPAGFTTMRGWYQIFIYKR